MQSRSIYRTLHSMVISRYFIVSLFFVSILALFPKESFAASFPADYDVRYTIDEQGRTTVEEHITIINETDGQYASQYTLALQDVSIENITATDSKGPMTVIVQAQGEYTLITAHFNDIVVGRGSKLNWTLRYDAPQVTKRFGKVWDVTIPQVRRDERVNSYVITVQTPASFGTLDYSDPFPTKYDRTETTRSLRYEFGHDNEYIGVVLSFGTFQLVDVALDYHLHNPKTFTAMTEVALPSSMLPYQKTFVTSLVPEPVGFREDKDGNVFAQYRLAADEVLDVHFEGQILIRQYTLAEQIPSLYSVDQDIYTREDEFWSTSDALVKKAAEHVTASLQTEDSLSRARGVYDYVTKTLSYNEQRLESEESLERRGAIAALTKPEESICTDFTDVSISLLRSLGIPAREINGYAFTGDEELPTINDVLHSWVQVYLPEKGWVNIDPTWGSTSGQNYFDRFDTKHVIFAIRGENSQYPFPAGSYKLPAQNTDDVHVTPTEITKKGTLLSLWIDKWEAEHRPVDIIDWIFRKFWLKKADTPV